MISVHHVSVSILTGADEILSHIINHAALSAQRGCGPCYPCSPVWGRLHCAPRLLSDPPTHPQLSVSPTLSLWDMLSVVTTTIDNPVCLSVCVCIHLLSVCLSIYPSVCVCLSVLPSVSLSACLSIQLYVCLSIRLSVCLFIELSYLSVHPSIHPSIHSWDIFFCLSIYPSIQLSIYPICLSVCHFRWLLILLLFLFALILLKQVELSLIHTDYRVILALAAVFFTLHEMLAIIAVAVLYVW